MDSNGQYIPLAVNGNLMRGLRRNDNLTRTNAIFLRETSTAPIYKLYSVNDKHPGMIRVSEGGAKIIVEIWSVPPIGFADLLQNEPDGLSIGKVILENGEKTLGIIAEPVLVQGMRDISHYGGWRAYISDLHIE